MRARCQFIRGIGSIMRRDSFADFVGCQRAVLVVPAVTRTVRRRDIEFDQMDMLANGIGRRIDLRVIQIQFAGNQGRRFEYDALAGDCPKTQRFGRPRHVQ